MVIRTVEIIIKPEFREKFEAVTLYNYENTRRESGNIRFDVLQDTTDPSTPVRYMLYEVFTDKQAVEFHKTTDHYKRWAAEMEQYMALPRGAQTYNALAFD